MDAVIFGLFGGFVAICGLLIGASVKIKQWPEEPYEEYAVEEPEDKEDYARINLEHSTWNVIDEIFLEWQTARNLHGPFHSSH